MSDGDSDGGECDPHASKSPMSDGDSDEGECDPHASKSPMSVVDSDTEDSEKEIYPDRNPDDGTSESATTLIMPGVKRTVLFPPSPPAIPDVPSPPPIDDDMSSEEED